MSSASLDQALQSAAGLLKQARHAVVFTGAGISTPSGIPDFRSKDSGLWEKYNPMEVASISVFRSRPERFYDWIRPLMRTSWGAGPNQAHRTLADMEAAGIIKAVITQNIDDLHQRAGSKNVFELHGSMRTLTCQHCRQTYPAGQFTDLLLHTEELPICPRCQKILKPDIVLFGEMLPEQAWRQAEEHCSAADVVLVVGSSLEVYPAAVLPEIGLQNGARLIIVNLSPTHLDTHADALLPMDVAEALPRINALIQED